MKKLLILLFIIATTQNNLIAQSVGINNTGASPHVSAILDLQSTEKGLLIPRMTQAQRYAIPSPAMGLMVYQTDQEKGFYYNFSSPLFPAWKKVGADALPRGMIVMSDSFPNSILESNGFSPAGALQNSMSSFGEYGRWTPTSATNQLQLTLPGVGVWTGTEALYWSPTDAKRYNPATDIWAPIAPCPSLGARTNPSCIWTGTEMIIWGGEDGANNYVNTGARYNPATNTWQPMSTTNAPVGAERADAFWTGTEVIFFGGYRGIYVSEGGKYNPATDTWTIMPAANGPGNRSHFAIVWTGSKLLVWGGLSSGSLNTGSIYTPATNSWAAMPSLNAPSARHGAAYTWTGTEMLIWGGESAVYNQGCQCYNSGYRHDGGKFNPSTMTWAPITSVGSPNPQKPPKGDFAGGRWFLFNQGGASYDPANNSWTPIPNTGIQPGQYGPLVVKAVGDKIFAWGSLDTYSQPTAAECHPVGGVWDPATSTWEKPVVSINAPLRMHTTPLWTGTEIIINAIPVSEDPLNTVISSKYNPTAQGFGNPIPKTLYLYKKN